MEKCLQCGEPRMMGRGYRASGVCRECYNDTISDAQIERIQKTVGSPDVEGAETLSDIAELEACPTCGHRLKPMTNAERQRRYREKKNG